jgi:hypothetical protein
MPDQVTSPRARALKAGVLFIAILVLLFAAWICAFWNVLPGQKSMAREVVKRGFTAVPLGASEADAWSSLTPLAQGIGYKLNQRRDANGYIQLITPPELGTLNWILTLDVAGGRIAGKSIRVLEGNYRPCDAPLDEGTPNSPPDTVNGRACL